MGFSSPVTPIRMYAVSLRFKNWTLLRLRVKRDPLPVYRVMGAKPRSFRHGRRGVEGIETRMIGRDAQLKELQDVLDLVIEDRDPQVMTISGEAGVGKSRLLHEFDHWMEQLPEKNPLL